MPDKNSGNWFKISLAEWSLHRTIFDGKMDNLDFAGSAKRLFGIDAVEYVNRFFFDKDEKYFYEMKNRADGEGVAGLLIMCDREGKLGDPDEKERIKSVEKHFRWVEAAKILNCHSIRVNADSEGNYYDQLNYSADGLRRLTEKADELGINIIVENHNGLSSSGQWLSEVIRSVDHPRCGTLPDFGNFRLDGFYQYDRYRGVAEMMPFAKGVSAKSLDFDGEGNETNTDFEKMMRIVYNAGYRGYVGIEYEGAVLSESEGITATKRLLERVREIIAAAN